MLLLLLLLFLLLLSIKFVFGIATVTVTKASSVELAGVVVYQLTSATAVEKKQVKFQSGSLPCSLTLVKFAGTGHHADD